MQPAFLDGILKAMDGISPAMVSGLLILAEVIFRMIPSAKPLSILVPVKYAMVGVAKILNFIGDMLQKLIDVANNVKPPQA